MPTKAQNPAKKALDVVVRKSRVHFYKPIQIAEILFRHRTEKGWNLSNLESYRNASKHWRDHQSEILVGRKSTSSQKFQDNLFDANAMPPKCLAQLGKMNKEGKGFVEAYIYKSLQAKLLSVRAVDEYVRLSTADSFSLEKLLAQFREDPGLRRSADKIYEILVYALFAAIVRALRATITLEIENKDAEILKDFGRFVEMVLGITPKTTKKSFPAALYRVGVTNAADRGLDMWANFGPAIQVKHLTLTPQIVEDVANGIRADQVVIVCLDAEQESIENLLRQVGWGERIRGIVTIGDLDSWYKLCLNKKYRHNLGAGLLSDVRREFSAEFPSITTIKPFIEERGYDKVTMPPDWRI